MEWIDINDELPVIKDGRYAVSVLASIYDSGNSTSHVTEILYTKLIDRNGHKLSNFRGNTLVADFAELVNDCGDMVLHPLYDEITHWMPLPEPYKVTTETYPRFEVGDMVYFIGKSADGRDSLTNVLNRKSHNVSYKVDGTPFNESGEQVSYLEYRVDGDYFHASDLLSAVTVDKFMSEYSNILDFFNEGNYESSETMIELNDIFDELSMDIRYIRFILDHMNTSFDVHGLLRELFSEEL